jgi:hypothetical protein
MRDYNGYSSPMMQRLAMDKQAEKAKAGGKETAKAGIVVFAVIAVLGMIIGAF